MAKPDSSLPEGDDGQLVYSLPVSSRLIYMSRARYEKTTRWYFNFRDHRNGFGKETINSYRANSELDYGNPQLSPDGKTLLFCAGDLEWRYGGYHICLWNFANRQISVAGDLVTYPETRWSPDSKYIGFYRGGDKLGQSDISYPCLTIRNVSHGKESPIITYGITSWAFTNRDTVLYSRQFHEQGTLKVETREYDLKKGTNPVLLKNAGVARPSLNGKWVAFLRTASEPSAVGSTPNTNLWIYDRITRKEIQIGNGHYNNAAEMIWSPDSSTLALVSIKGSNQSQVFTLDRLDISQLLTPTSPDKMQLKRVTQFHINGESQNSRLTVVPRFITRNSRYLIYNVLDKIGDDQGTTVETFGSFDLDSGQQLTMFRKKGSDTKSIGWDWSELPESK